MRDESKLNDLAAGEIAALEAEGITLTASEIVLLNSLAWSVECPESRRHLSKGVPVPCGASTLWPLTLYASDWLDRVGSKLGDRMATFAVGFSMAHAYDESGALDCEGRQAEKRVMAWFKSLRCTPKEFGVCVEQVLQQDESPEMPPSGHDGTMSVGDFSAFLCAACGGTPDFWERRCSQGYAFAMLNAIAKQNAADGKPTAGDPRIMAERALGYAAEKIRQRAVKPEVDKNNG